MVNMATIDLKRQFASLSDYKEMLTNKPWLSLSVRYSIAVLLDYRGRGRCPPGHALACSRRLRFSSSPCHSIWLWSEASSFFKKTLENNLWGFLFNNYYLIAIWITLPWTFRRSYEAIIITASHTNHTLPLFVYVHKRRSADRVDSKSQIVRAERIHFWTFLDLQTDFCRGLLSCEDFRFRIRLDYAFCFCFCLIVI